MLWYDDEMMMMVTRWWRLWWYDDDDDMLRMIWYDDMMVVMIRWWWYDYEAHIFNYLFVFFRVPENFSLGATVVCNRYCVLTGSKKTGSSATQARLPSSLVTLDADGTPGRRTLHFDSSVHPEPALDLLLITWSSSSYHHMITIIISSQSSP